ncbi:PEP/pyruvate-binding domain-containing protein [Streptomyces sp. NBC_00481]|uniref:PEP/pyruvate-binding domain-containing protein n=1 Tax=unclassified Streptomyces TaxID=2593676 RepID=UPI002DDB087B|nr:MULTISPECIES: PEP/pyruvate-binding domain-containing protein [unclassified Streptomyces]WRY96945.1 PEP/pyruvate-binding domain-containing protein [Streptomyces sp. NBC_00481]
MADQYTVAFDSGAAPSTARVGGKCAALLTMTGRGVPVPPGFAVTTDAFDAVLDGGGLRARIGSLLAGLDLSDTADTERRAAEVRGLVTDRPVPPPVVTAVTAAYRVLGAAQDVPVAVRSSAGTEDLPAASFAGQYDTYLGVRGADAVVDAVRRCWASLWTARAIAYRAAGGMPERGLSMAVGVQSMVDARTAGVAMTVNPADGDPSKIVIDAAWGLGEPVMSGETTPDHYVVDKVLLVPVKTTLSPQHHELVVAPDGHGLLRRAVEDARRGTACLEPAEVTAVAELAKRVERHYGCPQDVEWVIARDAAPLPDGGPRVLLLQARPETFWSRRPRARAEVVPGAGVSSIADTMLGLGTLPT